MIIIRHCSIGDEVCGSVVGYTVQNFDDIPPDKRLTTCYGHHTIPRGSELRYLQFPAATVRSQCPHVFFVRGSVTIHQAHLRLQRWRDHKGQSEWRERSSCGHLFRDHGIGFLEERIGCREDAH